MTMSGTGRGRWITGTASWKPSTATMETAYRTRQAISTALSPMTTSALTPTERLQCAHSERDENGDYTFDNFDAQKLQNVAEKVLQLFYGHGNASYDYKHYGNDAEQDDIRNMFAAGNAAMATLRIMALESAVMRDMKDEYGVVPMPKYDEAQKDYGTLLHDQFTVLSIPKTALDDRRDRISAVMEALCYTSYNIVRPAYYDVALRSKLVSDPDSAEMLDLLFSKVYIDAGVIYTGPLSGFHDQFRQLMGQKSNRVMSTYQKKARSTKTALRKNIVQKLRGCMTPGTPDTASDHAFYI